jgi:hypothetical protein
MGITMSIKETGIDESKAQGRTGFRHAKFAAVKFQTARTITAFSATGHGATSQPLDTRLDTSPLLHYFIPFDAWPAGDLHLVRTLTGVL